MPEQLKFTFTPIGRTIDIATASRRLGISERQTRRRCEEGTIPGAFRYFSNGHWRILEEEFNQWHENLKKVLDFHSLR